MLIQQYGNKLTLAEKELVNMCNVVDDPKAIGLPQLPPHLVRIMVEPCLSSTEEFKSALHDEVIKSNYEFKGMDTKEELILSKVP